MREFAEIRRAMAPLVLFTVLAAVSASTTVRRQTTTHGKLNRDFEIEFEFDVYARAVNSRVRPRIESEFHIRNTFRNSVSTPK